MSSCLGIYIENNIIKYSKVSKNHDEVKIEAFGIKFYDDIDKTLKQIISETYSFNIPIAINLSNEKYIYSDLFSLLNKSDLQKAIDTEFDYFCNENTKNKSALQYRYTLVNNLENKDKITALYTYVNKSNILTKLQTLDGLKVSAILPLPLSIINLKEFQNNSIIVNIEQETSITTVVNGQVYRVDLIDNGMKEILDKISSKENSYAKAFEICKNSTIYTAYGKNLQSEENDYMEEIMPPLYSIIQNIKDIMEKNSVKIDNIYLTGLATAINNIDLYFEENFIDKKCEVLVPYFAEKTNIKLNIKEYIEVNSATALALQALGNEIKNINFKNSTVFEKISKEFKFDFKKNNERKKDDSLKKERKLLSTNLEKNLTRVAILLLIILIIYTVFSTIISKKISDKQKEFDEITADTNMQINKISEYEQLVNSRVTEYERLISQINTANKKVTELYLRKNAIPNLLNKIMYSIPDGVQITSITNLQEKEIVIKAQAKKYEQLGYFKTKLIEDEILTNVTSTTGKKVNEVATILDQFIEVEIKGNLPY